MIISHKYKFIFVKTAKTAGTSIEVFLDEYCGDDDILTPFAFPEPGHRPRNYRGFFNPISAIKDDIQSGMFSLKNTKDILVDFFQLKKFHHHIPARVIKGRIPEEIWKGYYKFTVVRNPWEKIISGWFYYKKHYKENCPLDEYLSFCEKRISKNVRGTGICPYNIFNYTDPKTGEILVDEIIRYENLNDEFIQILEEIGINSKKGLSVHAKKGYRKKDYKDFYSKEQKEYVATLFKKEIELLGYSFS